MKIKCIIMDLDGTVLHDDKSISAYTISILRKCQEKGICVVVATARSEKAAARFLEEIKPDIVISSGGSLVKHNDEIMYSCLLKADVVDSVIADIRKQKEFVSVTVETEKGYYVSWEKAESMEYSHAIHYDFSIPLLQDAYKVTVELTNRKALDYVENQYPQCGIISFSDRNWYRIANKKATKMNAIREMASRLHTNLTEIVAFGDDYNDYEMVCDCGVGVAVGNAVIELKNVADWICDTNENDGVAKWIQDNCLQQ